MKIGMVPHGDDGDSTLLRVIINPDGTHSPMPKRYARVYNRDTGEEIRHVTDADDETGEYVKYATGDGKDGDLFVFTWHGGEGVTPPAVGDYYLKHERGVANLRIEFVDSIEGE